MSKTIDLQIEKSRVLIEGLRRNMNALHDKGFSNEQLDAMSAELAKLHEASEECDRMREAVSAKVKNTNSILAGVKEKFAESKKIIKDFYPQEEWIRYGVHDKR